MQLVYREPHFFAKLHMASPFEIQLYAEMETLDKIESVMVIHSRTCLTIIETTNIHNKQDLILFLPHYAVYY